MRDAPHPHHQLTNTREPRVENIVEGERTEAKLMLDRLEPSHNLYAIGCDLVGVGDRVTAES